MVGVGTRVYSVDNSGIRYGRCIKVYNGFFAKTTGSLGEVILMAVKKGSVEARKKRVQLFLITGVNRNYRRLTGHYVNFNYNKGIVLSSKEEFIANRIYKPLCRELRGTKLAKALLVGRKCV
jgi:large subunit ribosomal protein L14